MLLAVNGKQLSAILHSVTFHVSACRRGEEILYSVMGPTELCVLFRSIIETYNLLLGYMLQSEKISIQVLTHIGIF